MIGGRHFASSEIKQRVNEVNTQWESLEAASAEKRERLQQAYQVPTLLIYSACNLPIVARFYFKCRLFKLVHVSS